MPLAENYRNKLDGIVSQMVKNGESDTAIRAVVNDFKSKYENKTNTNTEKSQVSPLNGNSKENFLQKAEGLAQSGMQAQMDVNKGILQKAGNTLMNIGELGSSTLQKGYNATIGRLTGKNAISSDQLTQQTKEKYLTPTNPAQRVGFGIGALGETLIPLGGAIKGAQTANILSKGLNLGNKTTKVISSVGKVIGQGLETGALGTAQTGSIREGKNQALIGGIFQGVSEIAQPIATKIVPKISTWLERTNLRLTPTQQRDLGTKIDDAAKFINEKGITGSPEKRLEKIESLYELQEDALQNFLKNDAKKVVVDKQVVIDEANRLKEFFQNDRDITAIENQIDGFIELIKTKYPSKIPVSQLNTLKRSTFKSAFNNAGTKVRDDVEFALGDILKGNIENSTSGLKIAGKDIGQFNKDYGTLITARNLIKASQGRKQIGLVGRLVASAAGGSLGSALGGPIGIGLGGVLADRLAQGVAGTAVRSNIASVMSKAGTVPIEGISQIIPKLYGSFK